MNTNFFQGTKIMRFFVPNKFFGKKNALSSENNCFWQILGKKIIQNLSAYAPLRPLISSEKNAKSSTVVQLETSYSNVCTAAGICDVRTLGLRLLCCKEWACFVKMPFFVHFFSKKNVFCCIFKNNSLNLSSNY